MSMLHTRAARPAMLHAARGCAAAATGRASLYAAAGARSRPRAVSDIARIIRQVGLRETCSSPSTSHGFIPRIILGSPKP